MKPELPPEGTKCRVCGCCKAGIYTNVNGVRVPICMACDQDVLCAPQQAEMDAMRLAPAQLPIQLSARVPVAPEPQPQPAAPAVPAQAEPEAQEHTMPEATCQGGCGTTLPKTNKSGFAWGHKGGCPSEPPRTSEAEPEEGEVEEVSTPLSEAQLDRIWSMLPLPEKALAIQTALSAER